jgi:hypothetical protein
LDIFRECTGRNQPPAEPQKEIVEVIGRRGGKTRAAATTASWLAVFVDWWAITPRECWAPKEKPHLRSAARRGLRLEKSRRRDPNAIDYGGYMLVDEYRNLVIAGASRHQYDCTLADIEKLLENPSVKVEFSERGKR